MVLRVDGTGIRVGGDVFVGRGRLGQDGEEAEGEFVAGAEAVEQLCESYVSPVYPNPRILQVVGFSSYWGR